MNEIKNNNLYIRVSDKEKKRIEAIANKSGLSVSEYLRQRAFKYEPKAVLPEDFYKFIGKLDMLCDSNFSDETENKLLELLDEITTEFILPRKEAK